MYEIELLMITRILISALLGGILGIDREILHKPAGLRTHILVSVGASLLTMISIFYFSMDYARIVANIIVGIGFIGAGAIIGSRGHVQGITTAASVWIAAAVGISVGVGYYLVATVTTLICLLVLRILRKVEFKVLKTRRK